jgi:hypothetical protein
MVAAPDVLAGQSQCSRLIAVSCSEAQAYADAHKYCNPEQLLCCTQVVYSKRRDRVGVFLQHSALETAVRTSRLKRRPGQVVYGEKSTYANANLNSKASSNSSSGDDAAAAAQSQQKSGSRSS